MKHYQKYQSGETHYLHIQVIQFRRRDRQPVPLGGSGENRGIVVGVLRAGDFSMHRREAGSFFDDRGGAAVADVKAEQHHVQSVKN